MICNYCKNDFPERAIDVSHDVPCYMFEGENRNERKNQADKYGRHNLCKKCHDIYERKVFSWMIKPLSINTKKIMIQTAKNFALFHFGGINDSTKITS